MDAASALTCLALHFAWNGAPLSATREEFLSEHRPRSLPAGAREQPAIIFYRMGPEPLVYLADELLRVEFEDANREAMLGKGRLSIEASLVACPPGAASAVAPDLWRARWVYGFGQFDNRPPTKVIEGTLSATAPFKATLALDAVVDHDEVELDLRAGGDSPRIAVRWTRQPDERRGSQPRSVRDLPAIRPPKTGRPGLWQKPPAPPPKPR